jgi:hypothetical protein
MFGGIILMVVFGAIESLEWNDLGHDGLRKNFGLIKLFYVGSGDSPLILACEENDGTILRAGVGTLAIQFCRIMRNREEYFEELSQSDLRRVLTCS